MRRGRKGLTGEKGEGMGKYLLGMDIGTSGCKVAVFSEDGKVLCSDTQGYEVYYPHEGWAEQNPDDWYAALCAATKNVLEKGKIDPAGIAGVGIDGQGWSAIPLDREGSVLCNTPIWFDVRAQDICGEIRRTIGDEAIFRVCGNPNSPSYTSPKVMWYKKHLPEVYQKTDKILQSNSFIAYRLTGAFSQDVCQSYGLHFFDMRQKRYDGALCAELGLRPGMFPEPVPCHTVVGRVTKEAARRTGLLEGTPVVAGGLDAACGSLGAGVLDEGETQDQGGQAGGMSICMDEYVADPRLILSTHVAPDKYLLQGGTVGGGGVMRWLHEQFGEHEREVAARTGQNSFDLLTQLASTVPAGSDGLVFLPYMAGERSPIWDPHAKGVYYGIDYRKKRAHFIRAALEGAVFSVRHNLEVAYAAGAKVAVLNAMGGSANSEFWTQMKADITGKDIVVPYADEATTLGAAILAGVGVGVYGDFRQARKKTLTIRRRHTASDRDKAVYDAAYDTYLQLYENLKDMMRR